MMDFNGRFVVSEIFSTTEYASGWTAEASSGFVPFMIRRKPAACSNVFGPSRGTFFKALRDRNAPLSSRTEHGEEPVAEKLVHDAVVLVDGPYHEGPERVQVAHHLIRRAGLGKGREVADIEHHHAHVTQLGVLARRLVEQLIRHDGRHVLT